MGPSRRVTPVKQAGIVPNIFQKSGGDGVEYTLTVRQAERRRKNGLRAQKRRALGLPRYTLG